MAGSDSFLLGFDATPLRPGRTGVGTYTENLIGSLQETDGLDRIVLFSNRPTELDRSGAARRQVHEGDVFPIRAVWMQAFLPRILRKVRPALCHFPNYLAPLSCPCPRVVTFHDMSLFRYPRFYSWKKRHLSRALLTQMARRAEAVITVSESSRSEIVRILGIRPQKVHVIYEAPSPGFRPVTDTDVLEDVRIRYGLPESFVLHVGTLEPRKNISRLLSAFEGLPRHNPAIRDVRLVLAGEQGWKYGALVEANAWALELYPNTPMPCREELWPQRRWERWIQRGIEKALWPVWVLFERAARRLFGHRIRRQAQHSSAADVIFGNGVLKLHIQDRRAPVVERFRRRLEDEGLWDRRLEALL